MIERLLNNTKIYYSLLVLSFVVISVYAWRQADSTDAQLNLQYKNTQQRNLSTQVSLWEKSILKRIQTIFDRISVKKLSQSEFQSLERNLQGEISYFDGVYIDGDIVYPIVHDYQSIDTACALIDFYDCKEMDMEIQQRISIELAQRYIRGQKGQRAQEVLLNLGYSPLQQSNIEDMSPKQIGWYIHKQLLLIQAEINNGNPVGGNKIYQNILEELVVLPISYSITHQELLVRISQNQKYSIGGEHLWLRIQRKIQGYEQFFRKRSSVAPGEFEIFTDPYSATPYIIIQKRYGNLRIGVQLDPPELLSAFLEEQNSDTTPLILLDANGKPLPLHSHSFNSSTEKNPTEGNGSWFEVPMGSLFPHLRVSQIEPSIEARIDKTSILMPILFSGTLVFFAILGQIGAENRQKEFLERQRAFIARVTHELKTPLAGIRLMAESLQLGAIKSPEQGKKFVERILLESDRLEKRIDEVLQVSKGAELKKKEKLNIKDLLQSIYREWHPRFKEIGAKLQLDVREDIFVLGDSNLLTDAINNLLSNAIKYKKIDRELRCLIDVSVKGDYVEMSVCDNGIGVPTSHRKKIFERFVRVESDNRGFSGGHGLGLSFVFEAAQAHNGTIRCLDGFDGGCKFLLRIPKIS
jgi:signal transduction histidine kinase